MLLPVEWLKDFIEIKESAKKLANTLTMIGLETEIVESLSDKTVFEVDITPNRPDCLSVAGIAKELSVVLKSDLRLPVFEIKDDFDTDFRVSIDSPLCSRYAGRIITGVKIAESPEWLKKRLELAGIRPINNVVDITNYVLFELGHPLHAFDLNTLRGSTIRVDTTRKLRHFTTLDDMKRTIPADGLLIWDAEQPVAIAGIMGGLDTEVTDNTVNIFLEGAYFNPASIRRTSKFLGLKTEASYRFERGTDIEGLIQALDRATFLIKKLCGGRVSNRIDVYTERYSAPQISLRFSRIKKVLGIEISQFKVIEILSRLGFLVANSNDIQITLQIPTNRVDIQNETDLIEEIARHYGYEKIPSHIPTAPITYGNEPRHFLLFTSHLNHLKAIMKASGFHEAINYSFMNPAMLDKLYIPPDDKRRETITLINPLRKENSAMRTFLLPSLIENLNYNLNQGLRDIKLFEISKVFINKGKNLPLEKIFLGVVYSYTKGQRLHEDRIDVYYILKGILEKILYHSKIEKFSLRKTEEPFLHPGKAADIYIKEAKDTKIGYLGILSPEIKNVLELRQIKSDISILELDIIKLLRYCNIKPALTPLPRYPAIQRDIAFLVDKLTTYEEVLSLIKSYQSELIEDSWIFDLYEGKNIPQGKKSIGFSILYRAKKKTLTDEEVDSIHQKIVNYLIEKTGGELRK